MQSTKQLPDGYQEIYSLDLSKNLRAQLALNGAALILILVFGWLFVGISNVLTSEAWVGNLTTLLGRDYLLMILIALILMPILHEAVHGILFWRYTRQIPKFGLRLGYAYAAAPEWYLSPDQYLVVALAPFSALSVIGIALMLVIPSSILPALIIFLTLNAGGSVGDMFVVWKITRLPKNLLINDQGDIITIYAK